MSSTLNIMIVHITLTDERERSAEMRNPYVFLPPWHLCEVRLICDFILLKDSTYSLSFRKERKKCKKNHVAPFAFSPDIGSLLRHSQTSFNISRFLVVRINLDILDTKIVFYSPRYGMRVSSEKRGQGIAPH